MKKPRNYLFTSRHQSWTALIGSSLGLISLVSSCVMIYEAYSNDGEARERSGAVILLCLIFSLVGMTLSVLSRREPDRWYFFSYAGMVLNGIVLALCFVIMYLGVVV